MSQKKFNLPGFTASLSTSQNRYYHATYNDNYYVKGIAPALISGGVGGIGKGVFNADEVCMECSICFTDILGNEWCLPDSCTEVPCD